jgi:hypothetical protein
LVGVNVPTGSYLELDLQVVDPRTREDENELDGSDIRGMRKERNRRPL